MQILDRTAYEDRSAGNSIKTIEDIPLRGAFYDRNFKLLVNNIPAYTLQIVPDKYDTKLNKILEAVLEVEPGFIDNILEQNKKYSKFLPVSIKRGINFEIVAWLEENAENLPGVSYRSEMHRGYPNRVTGSHIFGYTREISPDQLRNEGDIYRTGDHVGANGLEKTYEEILRGKKGNRFVLVNSRRKEIGSFKNGAEDIKPVKGSDLILTIESVTQSVAEEEFKDKIGALVAIEPGSGEILALVSAPGFDLTEFSYNTTKEYLNSVVNDSDKPLFNRSTMSVKPPGSTYKMIAAIAGLDLGIITANSTYRCVGGVDYGRFFRCHESHGKVNVISAIEMSCNSFFYDLILKIGIEKWAEYGKRFGFGIKSNIDMGEESGGLIPTAEYYEKRYGENWPRSILLSLVIGQGETSVTPLQLAQYTALIANNGKGYQPHFVKNYIDANHKMIIPEFEFKDVGIDKSYFDIIKRGMYLVVNGEKGTAPYLKYSEYKISGKTGTAQNPHGEDHAWFIGFAPFDNPKIAIAVIVENVGFGGTHAAPIAKKVIETYLNTLKEKNNMDNKTISKLNITELEKSIAN
jgi:penicillin-binding protein 2